MDRSVHLREDTGLSEVMQMELLLFVIGLCVLGFLALRFGYDSRSVAPYSKEEDLARLGVSWELQAAVHRSELMREAATWRLVERANGHLAEVRSQRLAPLPLSRRVRRRLAAGLRAFARWLSPELATR
jgi:hypothetical protein